jgi:hypothetical protein
MFKILDAYPEVLHSRRSKKFGYKTVLSDAFANKKFELVENLLNRGAKNPIWNLLYASKKLRDDYYTWDTCFVIIEEKQNLRGGAYYVVVWLQKYQIRFK